MNRDLELYFQRLDKTIQVLEIYYKLFKIELILHCIPE